ncbi:MAG: Ig-like domain-containing protein [Oscillospiraceae bacterium]|nr:Ig-like domain-containing protein [Oscillospiraceae bacterium]
MGTGTYTLGGAPFDSFNPAVLQPVPGGIEEVIRYSAGTMIVPGDSVTITAAVTEKTEYDKLTPTGYVTFAIVNTDSGNTQNITAPLNSAGTVTTQWTPGQPGNYVIAATYEGDNSLNRSVGVPGSYFAYIEGGSWMALTGGREFMTYGEAADLAPVLYTATTDGQTTSAPAAGAAWSVMFDGTDIGDSLITGGVFRPDRAGRYQITARYDDGTGSYTASKSVTV